MAWKFDYMTEEDFRIISEKYELDVDRVLDWLENEREQGAQYYNCSKLDELDATYNLIYGKRANGKTFKICRKIIVAYLSEDLPSAYVRRLDEMIKQGNLQDLFSPHNEFIRVMTGGLYNSTSYRTRCFNLCTYKDGEKIKQDKQPFCRTYAINTVETTKGQDSGEIKYVLLDEFITRQFYLTNEFVMWQNTLSSIIRTHSNKVKIYMLANTVSKYCPYFREMGLTRIKEQQQGTIDLYTMGKTETRIAVEYNDAAGAADKVSSYFCFDNPELDMITSGAWEISLYRHIPRGVGNTVADVCGEQRNARCPGQRLRQEQGRSRAGVPAPAPLRYLPLLPGVHAGEQAGHSKALLSQVPRPRLSGGQGDGV